MEIIHAILIGLVVGIIAKFLMPGKEWSWAEASAAPDGGRGELK